jgi:hypothetical protein
VRHATNPKNLSNYSKEERGVIKIWQIRKLSPHHLPMRKSLAMSMRNESRVINGAFWARLLDLSIFSGAMTEEGWLATQLKIEILERNLV